MSVVQGAHVTHSTLEVVNSDASLRFYREVIGLPARPAPLDKVCHIMGNGRALVACVTVPRPAPQPQLNYFARPLRDMAAVRRAHARLREVQDEYGIREITEPAHEDPARFGVGTFGFYVKDADGNWWRIEENDGPFGRFDLPAESAPADSVVSAGPLSYVALESRDLARTVEFYRDYLGERVKRSAERYWLSRNPGEFNFLTV